MKHRTGSERARRDALVELHGSLDRRYRPEDVAELVLQALAGRLPGRERLVLGRAAQHSSRGSAWFTSMSSDYARPVGGSRQVAAAARLFGVPAEVDPDDPESLLAYASTAGRTITWAPDRTDFLADRLDREAREAAGMDLSKRQYNRRFRMLRRIAAKAGTLDAEWDKRRLLLIGVTGFGASVPLERFVADPDAACFVAYSTARRKLRREFSLSGRDNPFDEIAEVLLRRCGDDADWWMIAQVRPTPDVLGRLTDGERGLLLGQWSAVMRHSARLLGPRWRPSPTPTPTAEPTPEKPTAEEVRAGGCLPLRRTPGRTTRVRVPGPRVTAEVNAVWRRIERWLARKAPVTYKSLRPPARPLDIARSEASIGLRFPDDLRASLLRHDGAGSWRFGPAPFGARG
ncbi:hypothetical protein [Microbispora bryophytorum]|uniref:hypothetical protein n=1 Tax=Microbispora bryophytorum TaxID=1460882 RepID=UPI0033C93626